MQLELKNCRKRVVSHDHKKKIASKEKDWIVERQKHEEKIAALCEALKIKGKQLVDQVKSCNEEIESKRKFLFKMQIARMCN